MTDPDKGATWERDGCPAAVSLFKVHGNWKGVNQVSAAASCTPVAR